MKRQSARAVFLVLAFAQGAASGAEGFTAVYDQSTRVQRVEYKGDLVVQVAGFANTPFVIELNADEPIGDVALPHGAPYEILARGTRLFVRPLTAPKAPVTILVTSKTRSYVFDLVAGAAPAFKDRVSKIVFSYPGPPATAPAPALRAEAPPQQKVEVAAEMGAPAAPSSSSYRNDSYSMQVVSETVDVRPREAFDDGRFTYFKFPSNIEIPAIYKSIPGSKEEWLVNSHKDGDYTVMHGVAQLWNFRLAGTVLGIFNDSYEPEGVPPKNGTTVLGLDRVVKP